MKPVKSANQKTRGANNRKHALKREATMIKKERQTFELKETINTTPDLTADTSTTNEKKLEQMTVKIKTRK